MSAKDPHITAANLIKAIFYDPETGVFTRRTRAGRSCVGSVIGWRTEKGYIRSHVVGHSVLNHRLAWFYCYGRWPVGQIDHINHDKMDNRIANLREATNGQNQSNRLNQTPSPTGLRGVGVDNCPSGVVYFGRVKSRGRRYETKRFKTIEEAKAARDELARHLHGVFAVF